MNFTTVGLARIKTPEFLQILQQLPDYHTALVLVSIAACSDEQGHLVFSHEDDVHDFIIAHREQFVGIMMEAQSVIVAMHNALPNFRPNAECKKIMD